MESFEKPDLRGRAFMNTMEKLGLRGRAFVNTMEKPNLRGRAFVNTMEKPGLRGRAFATLQDYSDYLHHNIVVTCKAFQSTLQQFWLTWPNLGPTRADMVQLEANDPPG